MAIKGDEDKGKDGLHERKRKERNTFIHTESLCIKEWMRLQLIEMNENTGWFQEWWPITKPPNYFNNQTIILINGEPCGLVTLTDKKSGCGSDLHMRQIRINNMTNTKI